MIYIHYSLINQYSLIIEVLARRIWTGVESPGMDENFILGKSNKLKRRGREREH